MNTIAKAIESLDEFMGSEEKVVLITGTHQYKKHLLALSTIGKGTNASKILFRVNALQNAPDFLKAKGPFKTGTAYKIGQNNSLYVDTIRSITWNKSPYEVDFSVLYPLDSTCKDNKKNEIVEDLISRTKKKVFVVSWTDMHDYSWLNEYVDRHVILDAEEEDPEYHQRVLDHINGKKY